MLARHNNPASHSGSAVSTVEPDIGSALSPDLPPLRSCAPSLEALSPDLEQAARFLAHLDSEEVFTFQTFTDRKVAAGQDRQLARILHGTLAQHSDELSALNAAGAGVFVMVNKGDGQGRRRENVTRVRALFVDLDGAPLAPIREQVDAPPHIIVQSSPDRFHAYWLVEGCPLDEFAARQKALAAQFGGDPSVVDMCRVMRLPGFWHQKGEPFLTRLID